MLSLATGLARWESETEVKHERLSELWLRLRLQPVLLLRRLINCDGGKAAREALPPTVALGVMV
jgi:hypothetical protein